MVTRKILLEQPERWLKPHKIERDKLERAAAAACEKLKARILRDPKAFPSTYSVDFKYPMVANTHWETGLFTGCLWLAYQLSGDELFKENALSHLESYRERFDNKVYIDSHDAGFVYIPSCVAAYKLENNEYALKIATDMVDYYYKNCYSFSGKFIIRNNRRAKEGNVESYRTMMDSMMNAPLLFWASEHFGDEKYAEAAIGHVKTTADNLIRDDASSFHHYQFDPETSAPMYGVTLQGKSDDSCWSRGHSWGIYGFPIAYSYKKEPFIKEVHKNISYL